jgi:hypothetical protein
MYSEKSQRTGLKSVTLALICSVPGLTGCGRAILIQTGEVVTVSRPAEVYVFVPDKSGELVERKVTLNPGVLIQNPK